MQLCEDFENYLGLSSVVFFKWSFEDGWPIVYITENILPLLGYNKHDFLGGKITFTHVIHPKDLSRVLKEVAEHNDSHTNSFKHEPYRLIAKNKTILWVEHYTKIVRDDAGKPLHCISYLKDITRLKNANKDLEAYQQILNETSMITISDLKGTIIYANEHFLANSGYSLDEVLGKPHSIMRHPDTPKMVFKKMWQDIKHKKTWKGILKNRRKDGSAFYANITIIPFLDSKGKIEKYIGIRHDVTPLIEATNTIKEQSQKDNLTGLGNRFKLLQDIKESHTPYLALFDIARFGEINDFYGYKIGDRVIVSLSHAIQHFISKDFKLYRINADEFAILIDNVSADYFIDTISSLHAKLNHHAIKVGDQDIIISLAGGLSTQSKPELLATADLAKNHAKNSHLLFCLYSKEIELSKEYERNIFWQKRIKTALEEDKIVPFYQPLYNNTTQCIDKYEALVRIVDKGEIISPFHFLEIAKKTHQYLTITKKVIDKSFSYFAKNQHTLSINLTLADIADPSMRQYLWDASHKYAMGKRLILEIVESESIKDMPSLHLFFEKAKKCGAQLAIDDFGSGYSNFEYLIKVQANYIKIDGSIIQNIHNENGAIDIVKAIVSFAKARGMKTVAEFVSSKAIFDTVCALGIDYSQGYYIGEPKPYIL